MSIHIQQNISTTLSVFEFSKFYIFSIGGRRQYEIKIAGSKGNKWFARKYLQCRWSCCTIQNDVTQ